MDIKGRLLWVVLKTTRVMRRDVCTVTQDIEFLPQLSEQTLAESSGAASGVRISPVYLVSDRESLSTFLSKPDASLWLLYDTRPIELAAMLENDASIKPPRALFLSHGMASVLVLLPQASPQPDIRRILKRRKTLSALECWTLDKGRITNHIVSAGPGDSAETPDLFTVSVPLDSSPESLSRHLLDNALLKRQLLHLSARYCPFYRKGLRDVFRRSENNVKGIGTPPSQELPWEDIQSQAHTLVHLNSMLSYFLSQGLGGRPPILEYQGLLPSYTVFGVATAYQALWKLTHFIEDAFLRYDILQEMSLRYFTKQGADYHPDVFRPELDEMQASPDHVQSKTPGHLNLFSGRLGFHSSTWATAAPVDVLHGAGERGWNLLTLTHEMLHTHVDSLIEFVMSPNPAHEPSIDQLALYRKITCLAQETAARTDLSIIDRIRQKLGRYVLESAAARRHDEMLMSQLPRCPGPALQIARIHEPTQFRDMVIAFKRRMSEYIVHVLDFQYFYGGDAKRFLSLVITSWASIPSVYADVGHYVMRCLVALSTREMNPDTGTGMVEPLT